MRGRRAVTKKEVQEVSDVENTVNDSKRSKLEKDNNANGEDAKEAEETSLPKHSRGKPKKAELSVEENGNNSQRKTRGRPKKMDSINENLDTDTVQPKRSSRKSVKVLKSKLDEEDSNGMYSEEDDVIDESHKTQSKKSKGRPSKMKGGKLDKKESKDIKIKDKDDIEDDIETKRTKGGASKAKKIKHEDEVTSDIKIKVEAIDDKEDKEVKKESKQPKRKLAAKKEVENDDVEDESPPKRLKGKQKLKQEKMEIEEDEVESEQKDKKKLEKNKKEKVSKKSTAKKSTKEATKPERKALERIFVKKGAAPVDGLCPIAATAHVFAEGDDIWDCMLNQTNIQFNNNKYYIIQLLKDDNKDAYSVWMRWGRVGCPGQNSLKPFAGNLDNAKETFKKKFGDKTKNDWDERDTFEKVSGKYDLLKMDYSDQDETDNIKKEQEEVAKPRKKVESKLHAQVKALIELICDVKAMEDAVIEMKYDAKKAPLGKLTSDQVKAGYAALKEIESVILGSGKPSNKELVEACNAFYTRIPHYFGMKVPPLIRTKSEIQEKLNLLQALGDIQAAMTVINQPLDENMHPVDQQYEGLNCDLHALDKNSTLYQTLEKYLSTTHGKTHSMYKMKVLEIFEANKSTESSRFTDVGNRMLLWHGSRLTNWAGILSQGLRIAPPEAPCTGYMFGKGIYFADMASKSANYCMPSYQNKTGLLVLCDVSLGKCNELLNANHQAHKLPKGCHSVKGLGKIAPDSKNHFTLDDGVILPMGPGTETKVENKSGFTLQYNEFIVYDVSQVKIKYLMKVEFDFK